MSKTIRKDLAVLADPPVDEMPEDLLSPVDLTNATDEDKRNLLIDKPGAEFDRYMIALLRVQTIGRVAYRRLMGMHGGGFGTSQDRDQIENWVRNGKAIEHRPLMMVKADLDKERIILEDWDRTHNDQLDDDNGLWPDSQANVTQEVPSAENKYLCHVFCWHGQSPFLVWHRPFMVEFERLLQEYDPLFPSVHNCRDALGAHYYDWNGWDGMNLPPFLNFPTYKIKTGVFHNALKELQEMDAYNSTEGTILNPLYRWFAPMQPVYQLNEKFPESLTDAPPPGEVEPPPNCTTRDHAYLDPSGSTPFHHHWYKIDGASNILSVHSSVSEAMRIKDFLAFSTTTHNGSRSIENGHNLFHNRIGGQNGTMPSLQSAFDPIFFVHHSNVERQLMSWQKVWVKGGGGSVPPDWLMDTRLYPWTKPELVERGMLSWNTVADISSDGNAADTTTNDATLRDWWNYKELGYEYDEYMPVNKPVKPLFKNPQRVLMAIRLPLSSCGDFILTTNTGGGEEKRIDAVSIHTGNSSANGTTTTTCPQCKKRSHLNLVYDITGYATPLDYKKFKAQSGHSFFNELRVRRHVHHNDQIFEASDIDIKSVRYANKHLKKLRKKLADTVRLIDSNEANQSVGWNCISRSANGVIES